MRILGIDHGTVRIGLALSDEMELVANPLTTLHNGPHLINDLTRIIRDKKVGLIVIGYPVLMAGGKGSAAERVDRFRDQLSKALNHEIEIEFVDERLSSVTAERALKREGHEIDPKAGIVDQLAATVILQDFLNHRRGPESYLLPEGSFDMPWLDDDKPRRR